MSGFQGFQSCRRVRSPNTGSALKVAVAIVGETSRYCIRRMDRAAAGVCSSQDHSCELLCYSAGTGCVRVALFSSSCGGRNREAERGRERQTDREGESETEREREKGDGEKKNERQRKAEKRKKETERCSQRKRKAEKESEMERNGQERGKKERERKE